MQELPAHPQRPQQRRQCGVAARLLGAASTALQRANARLLAIPRVAAGLTTLQLAAAAWVVLGNLWLLAKAAAL